MLGTISLPSSKSKLMTIWETAKRGCLRAFCLGAARWVSKESSLRLFMDFPKSERFPMKLWQLSLSPVSVLSWPPPSEVCLLTTISLRASHAQNGCQSPPPSWWSQLLSLFLKKLMDSNGFTLSVVTFIGLKNNWIDLDQFNIENQGQIWEWYFSK